MTSHDQLIEAREESRQPAPAKRRPQPALLDLDVEVLEPRIAPTRLGGGPLPAEPIAGR